jgi:hypothetical protein
MSQEPQERTPKSDEAWKARVKAEAAALDAQNAGEDGAGPHPGPQSDGRSTPRERPRIDPSQLPPANFATLVTMFSTQAMVALGLLPDPVTGRPEPELALARHYIDLLGVIEEKTQGRLSSEEERLLESSLHELRMAYVELAK